MSKKQGLRMIALALSMVFVLSMSTGCHKKKKVTVTPPATPMATNDGGQPNLDVTAIDWTPWAELQAVYFAFDSYALSKDSTAKLEKNADVIKATSGVMVRVEGNCDERGTQEYNLALGDKRALAVRDYLIKLGVPGERIVTVSFGEEKPADPGHDEAAWSKNRRCDFSKGVK